MQNDTICNTKSNTFSNFLNTLTDDELVTVANELYQSVENPFDINLSDISRKDKKWDEHRNRTADTQQIYSYSNDKAHFRLSERLSECSSFLKFKVAKNGLKLDRASFCRVRYCPVCLWRKSLMYKFRMYKVLEGLADDYQFLFLTLTTKNPNITDLRTELQHMNKSWQRLIKRKQFDKAVVGWVRTTEVTRGKKNKQTANPHFHVILVVRKSYFKKSDYIKQADWVDLWQSCLKVNYSPQVNIKKIKPKGKGTDPKDAIKSAVMETFKYSVKSDNWLPKDGEQIQADDWFYELTRQTHKLRFFASGGILKNALKEELNDDDMIHGGDDEDKENADSENPHFAYFTYRPSQRKYISVFLK